MNEVWRCVYNNADQLYFAKVINDEVIISDGFNIVRRYNISHINGCTYNGDILWLSTEGSNCLLGVDSADNVTYVKVPVEGTVRIFKAASGKKNYLVLDISCEQKHRYVLFDYSQKTIVTTLPITMDWQSGRDTLDEIYVEADNNIGHIICEYTDVVSARYSDEMSDEDILFYADLSWEKHDSIASITRKIHLYIDYEISDDISGSQTLLSDSNLRFPLFDYYLQHWLIQKSFSVSGRHVVYYCPDICGLIVGEPIGGHVCQIIELPCEIAEETNQFFFNDLRNQLYVIDQDNMIRIYSINCSDLEAVEILNQVYDDAYVNGINLQRKRDAGDLSFWKILKRAIAAFNCEPVQQKNQNSCSDDRNSFKVTIETPVSGMLISERTHKKIVSFEDWKYKQEIFLQHTIDEETTFIFLPSIGQFSKMIRINEDVKNKGILSIEQELSIEDIECSCDRDAARKKLQIQPTNIYATTQQDEGLVRERLSVYSTEVYSMLRGDILLVNEKSEDTAARLVDFVDNSNGEDNNYEDNAELIFLLKNGIKKYLNGSSDDRMKTLPKTMANDSNFSLNVSAELREIRAILETIVEEKTDEKHIENLSSDELNEHNNVNAETECRADSFEDGSIKIGDLKKQEYSKITFKKFINMFINYSIFKMNMSKILKFITYIDGNGIIQEISFETLKRYMREDTYGKLDVQHYKPLFDLYEQTIKEEKERAELLVRAFSLSNQCRHLQYDDIKNIIIDILHEKCKSVSVRKVRKEKFMKLVMVTM